ncbi:MAG: plastocyanin/azurin family copper-binding protein, partial [Saprospiraceae bacterium]
DATSGPDAWNSGVIGGGSTFDVFIDNPGTHNYYCQPHGGPGGTGMSGQILSNCPGGSTLPLTVNFNTTQSNPAGYNVLWDNVAVPGSPFDYNGTGSQSVTIDIAGDGLAHTLVVRDVADPTCDVDMTYNAPDCNQGGGEPVCSISGTVGNFGGCNNDIVTATLTVSVTNGGSGFNVSIDNGPNTFHAYTGNNTTVTITLPGDGNNHTVKITDNVDPICTSTINVITPDCNLPCTITNLVAIAASGNGGSSGIVHTVNVQDFQFNPNVVNITVGDIVQWVWTGVIPHTTTSDATSGPNSWDSGLLNNGATYNSPLLSEGTHPYYCEPHGAPGGVGMSGTIFVLPPCNDQGETSVQVSFDIVSNGTQGFQILADGVVVGTFSYVGGTAQSATVNVVGDAQSHTITVRDVANQSCSATTTVTTSDCGGGGNPICTISVSASVSGGCVNNNVPVLLDVNATNNGASFTAFLDGVNVDTFSYSATVNITVPGDGNAHTIVVTDIDDPACTASASITTPDCTLPCGITISELGFGTNSTHTVQVQDFQFSPEEITINLGDTLNFVWTGVIPHTVTSDAPSGPNAFNSGLLGQGATWQLILNSTGTFPYYCIPHGAPGGIGMAGIINVTSACEGNTANGTLVIQYVGTSGQGFAVTNNGSPIMGSPFAFSPSGTITIPLAISGDGAQHTFAVTDVGNASCSAQQTVTVPSCNSSSCTLSITQATVSACMGNTVSLTVNFNSNQPAATYNVYKDGIKLNPEPLTTDVSGSCSYTTFIVGNNITTTILVQFIENTSCSAIQSVVIPACAGPCLITDFVVGQSAGSHTVEVKDFAFEPAVIDVLIGDTVHFVWTGVIPHTTTSDQFMGPNSWNSGLLGQGATYDLVIGETGTFPYYCQPHGGPGGIGMSGVINVIDTCDQERWLTNISFNVSAGSPLGYNVFVDGVKITQTPIQYDNPVGFNNEIINVP